MSEQTRSNPFWHPFADMGAVAGMEFVIARGEGVWVWDADGRRYLDGTAALWYANLGHGRPEIADAVRRQLLTLDAYSTFGDYANEPALELAERLSALAPTRGSKIFFGSGGGDGIDTAAKIARRYHAERGDSERVQLISRTHGYHGTHGVGTGIAGIPANAEGFGDLVPDHAVVAYDDPAALEAEIQRLGAGSVAAFFCEPVIGAGGVYPPPAGYVESTREICRRHGVLFVADCVINGFGRLGTWLGIDRWPVEPDLIVLAKGLTAGTLPLGAVIVAPGVAAPFFTGEPGAPILRHGATYAGHPTCCAAANVTLDIYTRENIIPRAAELEGPLYEALAPLASHPTVAEVRGGVGLLAAVELTDEALAADGVAALQRGARDAGVLVRTLGRGVAVSPPLVIEQDEIELIGRGVAAGLDAVQQGLKRAR
jgi:putrescine---pyruvate transaminase